MMALNSSSGADSSSVSSRTMISKANAQLRRRRSKGTIAGFASGKSGEPLSSAQATAEKGGGDPVAQPEHSGAIVVNSGGGAGNQPQHVADSSNSQGKPCHAARLALMCCHNAIRMGARTQLGLCPPGRARRGLKAALRQKTRSMRSSFPRRAGGQTPSDTGGYFGVDKMVGPETLDEYPSQEEDFLLTTNTFDAESDEEASSGDEDELQDIDELFKEDSPALDDEKKYQGLREPLFTPIGAEATLATTGTGGMTGTSGTSGKLPFNRRKLRYFDSVAAGDRMTARGYLRIELQRSKQREVMLLGKHLRRIQRQEKRKLREERGEIIVEPDVSDPESDDTKDRGGVSRFAHPMTPAMAAALILEGLSLNPLESIEGMAKCYDGIVAAGVALLESTVNDPTSPASEATPSVATRSEIMAALTPLLITSLEQPSGDVILCLARLRRMCGTPRYQRRFIQRVAPSLVRPPRGAMWCLRHHNDMEPILAACELIFDAANEIFSKGWYDRGQLLLADSKRAETLNTAAMQLRNLSTGPNESLTLGGFAGHGTWRASKYKGSVAPMKDGSMNSNEPLAEWEVIAVDRQIRVSISNIISMDWSRVVVHSRDSEVSKSYHRSRSFSLSKRPSVPPQNAAGDMSPKSTVASPHSPARPASMKTPLSPPGPHQMHAVSTPQSQPDTVDNSFPTNFAPHNEAASGERARSPISQPSPPPAHPISPPAPNRSAVDDIESRLPGEQVSAPTNLFPPSGHTSPRSPTPKSPKRELSVEPPNPPPQPAAPPAESPISPRRSKSASQIKESISNQPAMVPTSSPMHPQFGGDKERAPLSPSSANVTTAADAVPHRPISSASSVSSSITGTGSQPAHYRMLTSTAAERKRTVAACRALRAQITRFEDAFIQLHGRPPKGAAERAPLATTYAQYREWKRAIRADAACRIQALFRGARTRWILLRSNNPRMSRVVMTRAGRLSFTSQNERAQSSAQENVLKQLSIPAEIGEPEHDARKTHLNVGSDGFLTQGQTTAQSLPPQWGNQVVRRRSAGTEGLANAPVPRPIASPSSASSAANSELSRLPLSELQARKRELKQQLKQYDMNFARRHGRMPVKAEKEPIRHLYERYNALKSQISVSEQDGRHSATASPVSMQQSPAVIAQRTMSPVSGSESGGDESPIPMRKAKQSHKSSASAPVSASPAGAPSQDLAALKAEKGRLHQMLRSYEKDFFKEHKRQVSSFADIRPVASQYRRYKEIKKSIVALQQSGEK